MNRIVFSNVPVACFTLTLPLIAVIYAAAIPGGVSPFALVATAILAMATTSILFSTWRNAQPARIIGHVPQQGDGISEVPVYLTAARDRRKTPRGECP